MCTPVIENSLGRLELSWEFKESSMKLSVMSPNTIHMRGSTTPLTMAITVPAMSSKTSQPSANLNWRQKRNSRNHNHFVGGGEFWITQSEQGENFQVWGVIMFSQWGTGGVHPNNGRMCRTPILSPCFPSYLIHTHTHHILLLCSLMDYNIYKKKHIVSSTVQICGTLYFYSITLIW